MPKVLIADKMSEKAKEIFVEKGLDVDVKTGLDKDELISIAEKYDGIVVRSSTKITEKVLKKAFLRTFSVIFVDDLTTIPSYFSAIEINSSLSRPVFTSTSKPFSTKISFAFSLILSAIKTLGIFTSSIIY